MALLSQSRRLCSRLVRAEPQVYRTCLHVNISSTLLHNEATEGTMLKVIFPIVAISVVVFPDKPAFAQPPLVLGHYVSGADELFVDPNGDGNNARLHFFRPVG